jgi:hypothetical protein
MNSTANTQSRWPRNSRRADRTAALATLILAVAISPSTDVLLHATTAFAASPQYSSDSSTTQATAYHIVYGVLGHAILTQLAPARFAQHTVLSSNLATAFHIVAAAARTACPTALHCCRLASVVTAIPRCWLAAKLHASPSHSRKARENTSAAFPSN